MKKIFGFIVVVVCCVALCVSCGGKQQNKASKQEQAVSADGGVFVCGGKYAKRYHRTQSCSGLSNCQGGILEMTEEQAESRGLTPCKRCY